MECSGAAGDEGEIEMQSQDQSVDDMECLGAAGDEGDVGLIMKSSMHWLTYIQ